VRALFYDTETSGLPLFHEPSEDPRQPHIVQLAAIVVDLDTRRVIHAIELIVHPSGWQIPAEVSAIHGITHEYACDVGVAEPAVVNVLRDLHARCDVRIGHNESFDARILRIAHRRYHTAEVTDAWSKSPAQCTQALSTPILKLPPTEKMLACGRTHYKSANLREAYEFFMGKPLDGAHSAMADARACMDVWFAIQDYAQPSTRRAS
jgi:DNA polymerase-3 subunit epsilon